MEKVCKLVLNSSGVGCEDSSRLSSACRFIAKFPYKESGYIEVSRIHFELGNLQESLKVLESGLTVTMGPLIRAEILFLESLLGTEGTKTENYAARLEKLFSEYPDSPLVLERLLQALVLDRRISDAIAYGFKNLEKIQANSSLLQRFCKALNAGGLFDISYFYISQSEEISRNVDILNLSMVILDRLGYPSHAIKLFSAAKDRAILNERTVRLAASSHIQLWELKEARLLLESTHFDIGNEGRELLVILDLLEARYTSAFGRLRLIQRHNAVMMNESVFNRWRNQLLSYVVNECNVNQFKVSRIQSLMKFPLVDQLIGLRNIFREQPNFLGTSIAVLTTLRRNGMLSEISPCAAQPVVPRIVWMYWDQGEPPFEVRRIITSWERNNPKYQVKLMDRVTAEMFLVQNGFSDDAFFFRKQPSRAVRADLIRLILLKNFGGVYVDTDDLCRKPIDDLFAGGHEEVFVQEYFGTIANNFMGSASGSRVISRALHLLKSALGSGSEYHAWSVSGPQLMTQVLVEHFVEGFSHSAMSGGIRVLTWAEFQLFVSPHLPLRVKREYHWSTEKPRGENKAFSMPGVRAPSAA